MPGCVSMITRNKLYKIVNDPDRSARFTCILCECSSSTSLHAIQEALQMKPQPYSIRGNYATNTRTPYK